MRIDVVAALSSAAVLFSAPVLAAAPPRIGARLDYRAPSDRCPAEAVLRAEVMQHLGYDPFVPTEKRRIAAHIEIQGAALSAEISAEGGPAGETWTKILRAPEGACPALVARMGNVIAFYLDPHIFSGVAEELPSPRDRPPIPPALPEEKEAPKPPKAAPLKQIELGLGPALAIGASGPAFSLGAHAGFRWSFFSIGLGLRYDATTSARAEGARPDAKVEASALGGTLAPCLHISAFSGCLVLATGKISVAGSGIEKPHDPDRFYFGGGPRFRLEKRFFPWLGISLHGETLFMSRSLDIAVGDTSRRVPTPLASQVNGAIGFSLLTYFSP